MTTQHTLPHLFSFRRCPYAIRARMALAAAGIAHTTTEVVLRNKPRALLDASSKATVPVLVLTNHQVIDESLEIMLWALRQQDPQDWLANAELQAEMLALVDNMDRHFKPLLDRCKYPERYPEATTTGSRSAALRWLSGLEARLAGQPQLFGQEIRLADAAIFPFVRQFAAADLTFWNAQPLPRLQAWRNSWLDLPLFQQVMRKAEEGCA